MIEKQQLETLCSKYRTAMLDAENYLFTHGETGFKEWNTTEYMKSAFSSLGYTVTPAGNIPGFTADLNFEQPGPKILILAELDGLYLPSHYAHNPENGTAHACGHHAQCAALIGAASMLKEELVSGGLCGSVRFAAVPAEELIELEYRKSLIDAGLIHYSAGKAEFLYRHMFDDCQIALLVHALPDSADGIHIFGGCNGCIIKEPVFHGISSHAGAAPQNGVNALYAASLGLQAANALRETFPDDEHIRFHGIITEGGMSANSIPDRVSMEAYVRAKFTDALTRTNQKINRAMSCSAAALGAQLTIQDTHGAFPLQNAPALITLAQSLKDHLSLPVTCSDSIWRASCTDMGDLSQLMPTLQAYAGGGCNPLHSDSFFIQNPESAVLGSAAFQVQLVHQLLTDGAAKALNVIHTYQPKFAAAADYFTAVDSISRSFQSVSHSDEEIVINL